MIALYALAAVLFVLAMSVAGRAHGVGKLDENNQPTGWPSWSRVGAKVMFGVAFGAGNYVLFGVWWLALIGIVVTEWGLATGHGNVFGMKGVVPGNDNPEQIERWGGGWLWLRLYGRNLSSIYAPAYSNFIMGLKGLVIGLPVLPVGVLLFWLWPLAYRISWRTTNGTARGEWLSGGAAGLVVLLAVLIEIFLIASL